jgi:mono/diheme cytochrome c family protein
VWTLHVTSGPLLALMVMMRSSTSILSLSLSSFLLLACAGSGSATRPAAAPSAEAPAPKSFADQVARGGELYGEHCAGCHGNQGQGSAKAPPVVGPEALPLHPRPGAKRDVDFHTALDVFAWTKVHMPGDAPGSLADGDIVDILAFDLKANGVDLSPGHLDGDSAATVVLHP